MWHQLSHGTYQVGQITIKCDIWVATLLSIKIYTLTISYNFCPNDKYSI